MLQGEYLNDLLLPSCDLRVMFGDGRVGIQFSTSISVREAAIAWWKSSRMFFSGKIFDFLGNFWRSLYWLMKRKFTIFEKCLEYLKSCSYFCFIIAQGTLMISTIINPETKTFIKNSLVSFQARGLWEGDRNRSVLLFLRCSGIEISPHFCIYIFQTSPNPKSHSFCKIVVDL